MVSPKLFKTSCSRYATTGQQIVTCLLCARGVHVGSRFAGTILYARLRKMRYPCRWRGTKYARIEKKKLLSRAKSGGTLSQAGTRAGSQDANFYQPRGHDRHPRDQPAMFGQIPYRRAIKAPMKLCGILW